MDSPALSALRAANLSRQQVSEAIEVPYATTFRAFKGDDARVSVALKISRALGRTVEDLFGHLAPPIEPLVGPTAAPRRQRRSTPPAAPAETPERVMIEEAVAEFRARLEADVARRAKEKRPRSARVTKGARETGRAA